MKQIAIVLLALLVLSNLAWWIHDGQPPARATPARRIPAPDTPLIKENSTLKRRVAELQDELANWRQKNSTKPVAVERPPKPVRKPRPPATTRPPTPASIAKPWVRQALQLGDPAMRAAAIEKIRSALQSTKPAEQLAALIALPQVRELDFDKASFRPLVLPFFEAEDPAMRRAAIYALYNAGGPELGDLDRVLKLADDPSAEVSQASTHAIFLFTKGELFGRAAEAVLRVLATTDTRRLREAMRAIWGAKASPELQARLIEISKLSESRYDAIYFALSTMNNKSEAVVDVLIEAMADPSTAGRARWGLGYGVTESARPKVADTFLAYFETRSAVHERRGVLRTIEQYGTHAHLRALERHAADGSLPKPLSQSVKQTVSRMRHRLTR